VGFDPIQQFALKCRRNIPSAHAGEKVQRPARVEERASRKPPPSGRCETRNATQILDVYLRRTSHESTTGCNSSISASAWRTKRDSANPSVTAAVLSQTGNGKRTPMKFVLSGWRLTRMRAEANLNSPSRDG